MKTVDYITMHAAYQFCLKDQKKAKYVKLSDLSSLCLFTGKKKEPKQGWTFIGDWKRSVEPWYRSA